MDIKAELREAVRKIGRGTHAVDILSEHEGFQNLSLSTLTRWMYGAGHTSLVKARMRRAVEILTGITPEKKFDSAAKSLLDEIDKLERQLRGKIRLLKKLIQ